MKSALASAQSGMLPSKIATGPNRCATNVARADALLDNQEYHLEYSGYLSNHAKHAVIALRGLGASEGAVREYWNRYTRPSADGPRPEPAHQWSGRELTPETWCELRGRKREFPALVRFFTVEVARYGTVGAVSRYADHLIPGCAGAVAHGIIYLGWSLHSGNATMVAEGLAYQAYVFDDVHPERFRPGALAGAAPIDSLLEVSSAFAACRVAGDLAALRRDPRYCPASRRFRPELAAAGFQQQVARALDAGHPLFLDLPAWLDTLPVDAALEGLYKAIAALYLAAADRGGAAEEGAGGGPARAATGSFLVLHLLTSLFAIEQIVCALRGAGRCEGSQRAALKAYWAAAIALLAVSLPGVPPRGRIEAVWAECQDSHDGDPVAHRARPTAAPDAAGPPGWRGPRGNAASASTGAAAGTAASRERAGSEMAPSQPGWGEIVGSALREEEEHNIKLVYVCQLLWQRYGRWRAFRTAAATFTKAPVVDADGMF